MVQVLRGDEREGMTAKHEQVAPGNMRVCFGPASQRVGLEDVMGVGASGQEDQTQKHSKLQSKLTRKRIAQGQEDQIGRLEMGHVFMDELSPLNFMPPTDPRP